MLKIILLSNILVPTFFINECTLLLELFYVLLVTYLIVSQSFFNIVFIIIYFIMIINTFRFLNKNIK